MDWKTVGITANVTKAGAPELLKEAITILQRMGREVVLDCQTFVSTSFIALNFIFAPYFLFFDMHMVALHPFHMRSNSQDLPAFYFFA